MVNAADIWIDLFLVHSVRSCLHHYFLSLTPTKGLREMVNVFAFSSFFWSVAGNVFAFVLFVSPMWAHFIDISTISISVYICTWKAQMQHDLLEFFRPTFKRIVQNKSTEEFSGLPYIYSLLNCLICMWYGLPCVSYGVILVATVNSVGAAFQLVYVILFIRYANSARKVNGWTDHISSSSLSF